MFRVNVRKDHYGRDTQNLSDQRSMHSNHLTREKLEQLTLRWEAWEAEAKTPARRIVRSRLHLLFLLIRYGGLRLGEAIGLDAHAAIDTVTCMVHVPDPNARDVLLPISCMKHVRRILSLPEAELAGSEFLRFDQGFVRKKFYAVARPLGIDSSLAGPRAIRYSRGLELLELHVPLNLVQKFLGQQKPSQISAFLEFAGGEAKRIVRANVATRNRAVTETDRNSFLGIITDITMGMRAVSVEITTFSDLKLISLFPIKQFMRMEARENQVVTAIIDPDQITLAAEKLTCSLNNCVCGLVQSLHQEKVESFVCIELSDGTTLCTVQETTAIEKLKLREQKPICALFPSRAVRLCLD